MCVFDFTRKQDNILKMQFKIIGGVLFLTLGKAFGCETDSIIPNHWLSIFFQELVISSEYDYIALPI